MTQMECRKRTRHIIHFNAVVVFLSFFLSLVLVCFVWNSAINAKDYDSPHHPPLLERRRPIFPLRRSDLSATKHEQESTQETLTRRAQAEAAGGATHPCSSGSVATTLARTRHVCVFSSFQDLLLFEIRPIH